MVRHLAAREEHLLDFAKWCRSLDVEQFPFLHSTVDGIATHGDREQFLTGVEFLLSGTRAQVAKRASRN